MDETVLADESPAAYVQRVARAKADRGSERFPGAVILAADTTVVLDQTILGKPADATEGAAFLRRLSGRCHRVLSAVAVRSPAGAFSVLSVTRVWFRSLDEAEIAGYVALGEGSDKAGGYGAQGRGGAFVERIDGSYSGVIGLPMCETLLLLRQAGVSV